MLCGVSRLVNVRSQRRYRQFKINVMVFPHLIITARAKRALQRGAVIIDISEGATDTADSFAIPELLVPVNADRLKQLYKPIIICGQSVFSNMIPYNCCAKSE
ncbi:MAG: hypothetical protein ICV65_05880 [Flavisolibacter sp.]|nr:hypothetical protein [Flavisolibacter sp.]